jgi:hypothetical protein
LGPPSIGARSPASPTGSSAAALRVLVHLGSVAGVEFGGVRNASIGQVRLEIAPDGAASTDFGCSAAEGTRSVGRSNPAIRWPTAPRCALVANLMAAHHGGASPASSLDALLLQPKLEQPTVAMRRLLLARHSGSNPAYGGSQRTDWSATPLGSLKINDSANGSMVSLSRGTVRTTTRGQYSGFTIPAAAMRFCTIASGALGHVDCAIVAEDGVSHIGEVRRRLPRAWRAALAASRSFGAGTHGRSMSTAVRWPSSNTGDWPTRRRRKQRPDAPLRRVR